MSKELEALEFICKILKEKGIDIKWLFKEQYNTIKQRLESIDNSNPREALECLEELGTHRIEYREGFELGYTKTVPFKSTKEYKSIQQALLKAQ